MPSPLVTVVVAAHNAAGFDGMPDVIRHYLTHGDERERIVEAGYRHATEDVTMERSVTRILAIAATWLDRNEHRIA